jgi:AcrR family transcriptional regulator
VHELLAEGRFHSATVDEVAERAGVARATLYQHFSSRLELVDAICETFDDNPSLRSLRGAVDLADTQQALAETVRLTVAFWSSEDAVLRQLYGVAAVDPAAADLVVRQRADRRGEYERLVRNLRRAGTLRRGVTPQRALQLLMVLSSYESYRELREAGMSDRQAAGLLQDSAAGAVLEA